MGIQIYKITFLLAEYDFWYFEKKIHLRNMRHWVK